MRLFIAEKPVGARAIADVLPNRTVKAMALSSAVMVRWYLVIGHLLEQAQPDAYDSRYARGILRICRLSRKSGNYSPTSVTKQLNVIKRFLHEERNRSRRGPGS